MLVARYVMPAEIRHAGKTRMTNHLLRTGSRRRELIDRLVPAALAAADRQRISVPGEQVAAGIVKDLATEALQARAKIAALDAQIAELVDQHPDAALVQSLPGMGATLTTEFLAVAGGISRYPTADQLASAAGLAPTLQQSGKVRYLQRATGGDRTLKRVFYQSAICALQRDPASRAYNRNVARAKPTTRPSSPWPAAGSTCCTPSCGPDSLTRTALLWLPDRPTRPWIRPPPIRSARSWGQGWPKATRRARP